jgi:hypothetical protein
MKLVMDSMFTPTAYQVEFLSFAINKNWFDDSL